MSQLGLNMTADDLPPRGRRRREPSEGGGSARRPLMLALLALVVIVLAVVVAIRSLGTTVNDFTGEGTGSVSIVVAKGDSIRAIGRTLADAGVVASEDAFVNAADSDARAQGIAPGTYELRSAMSGAAAVTLLLDPQARQINKVAIPEGWRLSRTLAAAAKSTGLSVDALRESLIRAPSLGLPAYANGKVEGFLFPATYEFSPDASADGVISAMLTRFNQSASQLDLEKASAAVGLTPMQALTVASILEIEALPADYDKVARVIYNRLKAGMPLQMDSTVNYALGKANLRLTAEQLKTVSLYNTYLHKGLPPGPINSPGDAAIAAALNPADGTWLYFVATDPSSKTTEFATTYKEFLVLKRKFQASGG
ncbi:unannotated protein [freshwater metagenome]|uniref:Unannotated protein n=1 Tax=freshwater metagenome TaxID=449393 RepID=A0A6J7R7T3_9ZZZZ|nr:endolytic transglycosylase MltG [Actinomycetota bacterium]MSW36537.1 endolytic transglycosylase MltG [Actinomycetota bacterium]